MLHNDDKVGASKDLSTRLNLACAYAYPWELGKYVRPGLFANRRFPLHVSWPSYKERGVDVGYVLRNGTERVRNFPWMVSVDADSTYFEGNLLQLDQAWMDWMYEPEVDTSDKFGKDDADGDAATPTDRSSGGGTRKQEEIRRENGDTKFPLSSTQHAVDAAVSTIASDDADADDFGSRVPSLQEAVTANAKLCYSMRKWCISEVQDVAKAPGLSWFNLEDRLNTTVLSFASFEVSMNDIVSNLMQGVQQANKNGKNRLILDFTGNGGGRLCTGAHLAASLFGEETIFNDAHPYLAFDLMASPLAKALAKASATSIFSHDPITGPSKVAKNQHFYSVRYTNATRVALESRFVGECLFHSLSSLIFHSFTALYVCITQFSHTKTLFSAQTFLLSRIAFWFAYRFFN